MKILVLSDSHSVLKFMRLCMDTIKPDAVIHLGDYVADGEVIAEEYPQIPVYQVAGNCDEYRVAPDYPQGRVEVLDGCKIYFTHGHQQKVKIFLDKILENASCFHAQIALFGHTHIPLCQQEKNGLWVLNPGSCGYFGGSVGLIEVSNGKVLSCRIIREADLEYGI